MSKTRDATPRFRPSGPAAVIPLLIVLLLGTAAFPGPLWAESTHKVKLSLADTPVASPGGTARLDVRLRIRDGWHINANPATEGLIPTELSLTESEAATVTTVEYPPARTYQFSFSDRPVRVYEGRVTLRTELELSDRAGPGRLPLQLALRYQACNDTICLRPRTVRTRVSLTVQPVSESATTPDSPNAGAAESVGSASNTLMRSFRDRGWGMGLIVVFLLGLSLNLTPCVYPMVPITVGYFGGRDGGNLAARVRDGVLFVVGMALVYAVLGAVAGVTGSVLGSFLQHPAVQAGMALFMVGLAGSMFGFYELQPPRSLIQWSDRRGRALGTLGMGMVLGVVAAPCLAPATIALLVYVGQIGSFGIGAGLFFVLALGLGLPYILLAVFSSSLASLPSSGAWMQWVKSLLGFVILGVALYFIWPMVTNRVMGYLVIGWLVLAGVTLATIYPPRSWLWNCVRAAVLILVVGGGIYGASTHLIASGPSPVWEPGMNLVTGDPIDEPTVVYVGADWCVPCKEMELSTFRNPDVIRGLTSVRAVKIDLSQSPPPRLGRWLREHRVAGVPTMMFFRSSGREQSHLRIQGYVSAGELLRRLRRLDASSKQSSHTAR